jgi:hypothetical protein
MGKRNRRRQKKISSFQSTTQTTPSKSGLKDCSGEIQAVMAHIKALSLEPSHGRKELQVGQLVSSTPVPQQSQPTQPEIVLNEGQGTDKVKREEAIWDKHLTPEALARAEESERKEREALASQVAPQEQQLKKMVKREMPKWADPMRAAPSAILRSSLFGLIHRGEREYASNKAVAAWKGTNIRYTGKQLDQYDLDVWMQAIHLGQHQNTGNRISFTARSFLKGIGRKYSGYSANTLFESLNRMVACAVTVDINEVSYTGSLIEMFAYDKQEDRYVARLNPELCQLFDTGHTRMAWQTRLELPVGLSRWLHGYILSHRATKNTPHRITVEALCTLTGSSAAVLKKFRQMLKHSMKALEQANVVQKWRITEKDALEFVR